ncbi:MAG: hypothetical protein B0D92_06840 [Spirochaeta sp. LUC14_002_19_P3]|nr:MAG: hypothetical protein B0D92_06840 [Spirochaeta sp. LUC14_002_19_P3]
MLPVKSLYPLDITIAAVFLALIISAMFFTVGANRGTAYAEAETAEGVYYLPLDKDGELTVHGPIGETLIRVKDGAAQIVDSDCRDKICVTMGQISRPAAWTACLPNRVFLRITAKGGRNSEEADAGAY